MLHSNLNAELGTVNLSEYSKGISFGIEVVFTHNDVLSGNVMIPLDADTLESVPTTFIDYEYAGYNCRAFDLGNHFCGMNYYCCFM